MKDTTDTPKKKHPGGRPRTRDREKIFKDLVDWAKKDDSINLCKFCMIQEIAPCELVELSLSSKEFTKAMQFARGCIGARREEKLSSGELHSKAYDLNARTYDYFMKADWIDEKEIEARLKKASEAVATTQAQNDQIERVFSQLSSLQSGGESKSARKIADNSNSNDCKS